MRNIHTIIIIFLSLFLTYAYSNKNEWIIVWGNWKLYNSYLISNSEQVPHNPPGAINKFNAIIYKNRITVPFKLKLKFKINKLINTQKSGICGLSFEIKNGDNFYAIYVKIINQKYYFVLCRAYSSHKNGKKSKNYKFKTIRKKRIYNLNFNKWYMLNIYREREYIKIRLNSKDVFIVKNIETIINSGRICLITDNVESSFKNLQIWNNKQLNLYFNKSSMKLKELYIKYNLKRFQNPAFGP